MKVLVTGGAGFIGSHVCEGLLKGHHQVVVVDDFNDFYDPSLKRRNVDAFTHRAQIVETDIRDEAKMRELFAAGGFDRVIHLAARAGVRPSLVQPQLYTDVNIVGTQRQFIFASSSSVYGVNQAVPFSEEDPIQKPISPYAATKLAGEALCHVYHHLYGVDIVCLRLFTVYGPRQRPDLAIHKFVRAIARGQPVEIYGDGCSARDYTYIDDIVQGLLVCLDKNFGFEIINLGESRTVQLLELVRLIEQALGKSATLQYLPEQPGDVPITFANIAKAQRLLNYQPRVAIEQGLSQFVEWFTKSA